MLNKTSSTAHKRPVVFILKGSPTVNSNKSKANLVMALLYFVFPSVHKKPFYPR